LEIEIGHGQSRYRIFHSSCKTFGRLSLKFTSKFLSRGRG
jgi:hypothetical protein